MDLEAEKNLARHAARLVRFEGQMNCRDLGGLPTEDGGELATGRIYRSGRLSNLSTADIEAFTALGIRQLFDFRLQFERENYPNPDPASLNLTEHHHGYLPEGAMDMFNAINDDSITADGIRAGMRDQYRLMAIGHPEVYTALYRCLIADDSKPFLFHCSGGKDRTGVAAALLQRIGGVDRETVIADYLLTNLDVPPLGVLQGKVSDELRSVVGYAHRELIETALDAVENEYDDYAAFVCDGIGLSEAEYQSLVAVLRG